MGAHVRRERLMINCDICEQDNGEIELADRIVVVDESGKVWHLDLCYTCNGNTRPTQLPLTARTYGTRVKPYITNKGLLGTVSIGSTRVGGHINPHSPYFHEPGGAWSGDYQGPAQCLVLRDNGDGLCNHVFSNVIGLKRHQWSSHGIKVKT